MRKLLAFVTFLTGMILINESSSSITNDDYLKLISHLDEVHLGRGTDTVSKGVDNRPMAYGLILSAMSNSYIDTGNEVFYAHMKSAGNWLLKNSNINKDQYHGYGRFDAWDAFNDDSINLPFQEYTIITAVVVRGLLDWFDADIYAPKERILIIINACLEPYISGKFNSPSGLYAYSFSKSDVVYDVVNSAALMASQIQRYSQIINDEKEKEELQKEADRIMKILLNNQLIDDANNVYWYYGLSDSLKRPNDLSHTLIIIESIKDYMRFHGRLTSEFDFSKVKGHIDSFFYNKKWNKCNYENICVDGLVYLRALGRLLYLYSIGNEGFEKLSSIINQISEYKTSDGSYVFVVGSNKRHIRDIAHLLRGTSYYFSSKYNETN